MNFMFSGCKLLSIIDFCQERLVTNLWIMQFAIDDAIRRFEFLRVGLSGGCRQIAGNVLAAASNPDCAWNEFRIKPIKFIGTRVSKEENTKIWRSLSDLRKKTRSFIKECLVSRLEVHIQIYISNWSFQRVYLLEVIGALFRRGEHSDCKGVSGNLFTVFPSEGIYSVPFNIQINTHIKN